MKTANGVVERCCGIMMETPDRCRTANEMLARHLSSRRQRAAMVTMGGLAALGDRFSAFIFVTQRFLLSSEKQTLGRLLARGPNSAHALGSFLRKPSISIQGARRSFKERSGAVLYSTKRRSICVGSAEHTRRYLVFPKATRLSPKMGEPSRP